MKDLVDRIKAYLEPGPITKSDMSLAELGAKMIRDGEEILELCDTWEAQLVEAMAEVRDVRGDAGSMIQVGRELLDG